MSAVHRLRRAALALALLLPACGSDEEPAPPPTSLRRLGLGAERLIGSAVAVAPLDDDHTYRRILAREFNYVTAENAMKWDAVHPDADLWDFAPADRIVNFARRHGMAIKGHTLVWHSQLPGYVETLDPAALRAAVEQHIRTLVGRYRGRVRAWDVVNEPIALSGGGLRRTVFLDALGPEYIADAFRWAHDADPDALLFLNEFSAEGLGAKSDGLYRLAAQLLADGVPLHGVGFQTHLGYIFGPPPATMRANLERFAALGLRVNLSEVDYQVWPLPGDLAARLEVQRRGYVDVVAACLAVPACEAITFWGVGDRYSWIDYTFGVDDHPLLFDDAFLKKPAYHGVADALRTAR